MVRRFYGWTLLAVVWLIMAFNLGVPAYSPSVINPEMGKSLAFTRDIIGLMMSIYVVLSGLPGPLVAMMVNRLGSRTTIVVGSLMIVAGAVGMATVVNSALGAYLCFGVLVGGGVSPAPRSPRRRCSPVVPAPSRDGAVHHVFGGRHRRSHRREAARKSHSQDRQLARCLVGDRRVFVAFRRALPGLRTRKARGLGQAIDGVTCPIPPRPAPRRCAPSRHSSPTVLGVSRRRAQPQLLAHPQLLVRGQRAVHAVPRARQAGARGFRNAAGIGGTAVFTMTISGLIAKAIIILLGDRIDPRILGRLHGHLRRRRHHLRSCQHRAPRLRVRRLPWHWFRWRRGVSHGCSRQLLRAEGVRAACGIAIAVNTTLSASPPRWPDAFRPGLRLPGYLLFSLAGWCFVGSAGVVPDPQARSADCRKIRMRNLKEGDLLWTPRRRAWRARI